MSHYTSEPAPRPLSPEQRDPWPGFLRTMFWIGVNTFGGPVAQIGVMHQEAVEKLGWLSDGQFTHLLNFANILPGPEALEIAIHLGYLRRGVLGGIAAGLLFIWPGFVSLTLLAVMYQRYGRIPGVIGFFDGVRPIAVALIAFAVLRLSLKSLKGLYAYGLMAVSFAANFALDVPFLLLLFGAGIVGLWLSRKQAPDLGRWQQPVIVGALVTVLCMGWLFQSNTLSPIQAEATTIVDHSTHRYLDIAWVNTKAAFVTFGGAYTVLPYLREQMVDVHHWVTNAQVADALALGETTPGPLISFGIFLSCLAGGVLGAIV